MPKEHASPVLAYLSLVQLTSPKASNYESDQHRPLSMTAESDKSAPQLAGVRNRTAAAAWPRPLMSQAVREAHCMEYALTRPLQTVSHENYGSMVEKVAPFP